MFSIIWAKVNLTSKQRPLVISSISRGDQAGTYEVDIVYTTMAGKELNLSISFRGRRPSCLIQVAL